MTTIGRTHTGKRREYASYCDYCGVLWLRSQLRRNANGYLVCPDDREGRCEAALDRANARNSAASRTAPIGGKR